MRWMVSSTSQSRRAVHWFRSAYPSRTGRRRAPLPRGARDKRKTLRDALPFYHGHDRVDGHLGDRVDGAAGPANFEVSLARTSDAYVHAHVVLSEVAGTGLHVTQG